MDYGIFFFFFLICKQMIRNFKMRHKKRINFLSWTGIFLIFTHYNKISLKGQKWIAFFRFSLRLGHHYFNGVTPQTMIYKPKLIQRMIPEQP